MPLFEFDNRVLIASLPAIALFTVWVVGFSIQHYLDRNNK